MNNRTLIFLVLLFYCQLFFAQQISLNGQVYIHNSGYNDGVISNVENVIISADFTAPTSTDVEGKFNLIFSSLPMGTSVGIKVEKHGWDIVNKRDLQKVVIGRLTPVRIYLAKRGEIDQARTELYDVSLRTLTTQYNNQISKLQQEGTESDEVIRDLEHKINREIRDRLEAIEILNRQFEVTKQRLPDFALKLAKVNLDFASEMYRTAYEYFKQGEIEKAIETIDEVALDEQAEDAKIKLWQAREDIANLDTAMIYVRDEVRSYLRNGYLKAKSLQEIAENEESLSLLDHLVSIAIGISNNENKQFIICYQKAAQLSKEKGHLDKAYYYFTRAMRFADIDIPEEHYFSLLWEFDIILISDCKHQ